MNQLKIRLISVILLVVVFASCEDNAVEPVSQPQLKGFATSPSLQADAVVLDKVDLYLQKLSGASGAVGVEIKSMEGELLGAATSTVDALPTGASWVTFQFPQALQLTAGTKYKIEVLRLNQSTPSANIFWRVVRTNAYAAGVCDISSAYDYAFKTYNSGVVDQQQISSVTVWPVLGSQPKWQEFVAGNGAM